MSAARTSRPSRRGESFTPELSGDKVGNRVEILRVAAGVRYFKPGQFGYIMGQNPNGGMWLLDTNRESEPGQTAFLIAKTRDARGGAFWFSPDGVRLTGRGMREMREDRSDSPISMTYGQFPPEAQFRREIRTRINPDNDEPYWPAGSHYPMELVDSSEIECAEGFGLTEFHTERARTGRNTRARGFSVSDPEEMYHFLEYLVSEFENGNDEAGNLASSIMTTLGYEWI